MKCHQCPRPAFYKVGEASIPLCLECWHKWEQANYMQFLQSAALSNQALDDMEMVSGVSLGGGRIPVAALAGAMRQGSTYNNINVSNSTVGVLNTGNLARIDAVITLAKGSDVEEIADSLKELTQTIIDAQDIEKKVRQDLIDLIQHLAEQVVGLQGGSKPSVIMTLLRGIEDRARGIIAISGAVDQLVKAVTRLFSGG